MRKHLRAIARANMKREGFVQINKPRFYASGAPRPSYFADAWRSYLKTPKDIEQRAAKIRSKNEAKRTARNAARA